MNKNEAKEALFDFLPPVVGNCLRQIEIVGRVLDEYEKRYPEFREYEDMMMFCRSNWIEGWDSARQLDLYELHVRELLDRVVAGTTTKDDLSAGTDAEVLVALSECSLKAPPSRCRSALQIKLTMKLLNWEPEQTMMDVADGREQYQGEHDREMRKLRQKLRGDRKLVRRKPQMEMELAS